MSEILTIDVRITQVEEVKGTAGEACMLSFDGTVDCPLFKGVVLPTGCDTQKENYSDPEKFRDMSARYILVGKDNTGADCRIFIENHASMRKGEDVRTVPTIYTDSKALAFLETAKLHGEITGREGGVVIHFFED